MRPISCPCSPNTNLLNRGVAIERGLSNDIKIMKQVVSRFYSFRFCLIVLEHGCVLKVFAEFEGRMFGGYRGATAV